MEPNVAALLFYALGIALFVAPVNRCSRTVLVAFCRLISSASKTKPSQDSADEEEGVSTETERLHEQDEDEKDDYWNKLKDEWYFSLIRHIPHALKVFGSALLLFIANEFVSRSVEVDGKRSTFSQRVGLRVLSVVSYILLTGGALYFVFRIIAVLGDHLSNRAGKTRGVVDDQIVSLSRNLLQYMAVGITLMMFLETFDVDTTSLITVTGVLSLSVALGASDVVKNLFGLFIIVLDRPFVLGDHVKIGSVEGTVFKIKLRHTTIKTFNGTRMHVPNATFISTPIENFFTQAETKMNLSWVVNAYRPRSPAGPGRTSSSSSMSSSSSSMLAGVEKATTAPTSMSVALRDLRKSLIAHTKTRCDTGSWVDVNMAFEKEGVKVVWTFTYTKGEGSAKTDGDWSFFHEARDIKEDMLVFAMESMARLGLDFAGLPIDVSSPPAGHLASSDNGV